MIRTFAVPFIVLFSAILSGCANKTPSVSNNELEMQKRYETTISNDDQIYEKTAKANQLNFRARKDLELKTDLKALESESKLNPAIWTDAAVLNERDRKKKLHDDAIRDYEASQAKNDALRAKNREINLKSAREIGNALNPPKAPPPSAVIVDDEKVPPPPPLIQP